MSTKKGEVSLLLPGADGWEIWSGSPESLVQKSATEEMLALDVAGIPNGNLGMALPVRQVSALPFRAPTTDLALLEDLAGMHLERSGARPALDGGQLTDHLVYQTTEEETLLTAVVLSPPQEGQLPRKSPKAFDISPRCLPLPLGEVVIWRELGRWVFALGKPGQVLYFQCLSGERLDEGAGNEIRLALVQLQIQGLLDEVPERLIVWVHGSLSDPRPEELEALSRGAGVETIPVGKPTPVWPSPPTRLLPADVRAERVALQGKRNRNLIIAAVLLAYLGIAGFLFWKLQETKSAAESAKREVASLGGGAQLLLAHQEKWDKLRPVVEHDFYPYELLLRVFKQLPNSGGNRLIRLTEATITNQYQEIEGDLAMNRTIRLQGQAPNNTDIPKFSNGLRNAESLGEFNWVIQPETKDRKSGQWTFTYEGTATQ